MNTKEKQFREYLAYFGSDIETWPKYAQALGCHLQHEPEFAILLETERRFERLLLECPAQEAPGDLAGRIIGNAMALKARRLLTRPQHWYSELVTALNPAALAATLLLGVALGFGSFTSQNIQTISSQSYAEEEGIGP